MGRSNKPFERLDLPVRKAKKVQEMSNLEIDAMRAKAAGVTYGHFKALHPETTAENDAMREQLRQDLEKSQAEKAAQAKAEREKNGSAAPPPPQPGISEKVPCLQQGI